MPNSRNGKISSNTETRFRGLAVSEGLAIGRACLFNERRHSNLPIYRVMRREGIEMERERFTRAAAIAIERLDALIQKVKTEVGPAEAEIFVAQKMILADEQIGAKILAAIADGGLNAESAVARVMDQYEARLRAVDNEYVRERASDIGEARSRLLDALRDTNPALQCAEDEHCQRGKQRIVIAEELTPSLTVELDTHHTLGFVTERGGMNSHAAILARALGIPAVTGIENIHSLLECGADVLVNGDTGEVIIWPSRETLSQLRRRLDAPPARHAEAVAPIPGVRLMANLSLASEAQDALAVQAEGVGLYRTEFEFMAAGKILDEDEQFERYAALLRAMNGQDVYFRLLDLGSDKPAPFLETLDEPNPALGLRGARFLLKHPDLLRTQARALARAAAIAPIHVLYPMIIDREQFCALKKIFMDAIADLLSAAPDRPPSAAARSASKAPAPPRIRHGVMFETPSACLDARELFTEADFGSIGANDLIQYLFAVDRDNEHVADDYRADRSALWKMIELVIAASHETKRPLSLCGEMARAPKVLARLVALGLKTVSVNPRSIPELRRSFQAK